MSKITYVSHIIDKVFIKNVDSYKLAEIIKLGAMIETELEENTYSIEYKDINEKINILSTLRDIGLPMAGGKDWCPSDQFEMFRQEGLLDGTFKKIIWYNPDNHKIFDV